METKTNQKTDACDKCGASPLAHDMKQLGHKFSPETRPIGRLYACIAGDHRYGDTLEVSMRGGQVLIHVKATMPIGGMDSFAGTSEPEPAYSLVLQAGAKPREILAAIKAVIARQEFSFKQYGKPTRNFTWHHGAKGLSLRACEAAIAWVMTWS